MCPPRQPVDALDPVALAPGARWLPLAAPDLGLVTGIARRPQPDRFSVHSHLLSLQMLSLGFLDIDIVFFFWCVILPLDSQLLISIMVKVVTGARDTRGVSWCVGNHLGASPRLVL